MRLSKERKVYAALLGMGVAALVVDKMLFAPGGAHASPGGVAVVDPAAPVATPAPGGAAEPGAVAAESTGERATLAARLRAAAERAGVRDDAKADAFGGAPSTDAAAAAVAVEPTAADRFRAARKVTALMTGGEAGAAVVDGKLVRAGETVDGFVLVGVDGSGAHFERDGERVTLVPPEVPGRANAKRHSPQSPPNR